MAIDPLSIQALSTIIAAIIAGVTAIAVAYIQASAKSESTDKGILVPQGMKIHRKRSNSIGWIFVLTIAGGGVGYLLGSIISPRNPSLPLTPDGSAYSSTTLVITSLLTPTDQTPMGISSPTFTSVQFATSDAESSTSTIGTITIDSSPTLPLKTFIVTMKDGKEFQLNTLAVGHYIVGQFSPSLLGYEGVPTEKGMWFSFDYINRVDINEGKENAPATITLIDGSIVNETIKFGDYIYGKADLGEFKKEISSIKSISIQRKNAVEKIPQETLSGLSAKIISVDGKEIAHVTEFKIIYEHSIPGNTVWCDVFSYSSLPTSDGLSINFTKIKEMEFIQTRVEKAIPVRITTLDEKVYEYQMGADYSGYAPCGDDGWRVGGKWSLGKAEIPIIYVGKVVFK